MLKRWVTLITLVGGLSAHSLFAAPLATTLETRFAGNATQLRFEERFALIKRSCKRWNIINSVRWMWSGQALGCSI